LACNKKGVDNFFLSLNAYAPSTKNSNREKTEKRTYPLKIDIFIISSRHAKRGGWGKGVVI